jgi:protein-tyrosine-phosphatase/DNA-binding transcriptional ArsR family regulator
MDLETRARRHAALGDPVRLAIVDDLMASDRSPAEVAERHGLATNLLAHHLAVLERADLIDRARSSGDGRRRYVHLRRDLLDGLQTLTGIPQAPVLFICTHNSARSQMAAAAWTSVTGAAAISAGTHPAERVHPGAIAAARRAGLDLAGAVPRSLGDVELDAGRVVTVCDRAHEELQPASDWWHWSIPDPVEASGSDAFDAALDDIMKRIDSVTGGSA